MLKIQKINKNFGGIRALNKCSMDIAPEEITAIIGPNGSGKTTLFNVISRVLENDGGHILYGDLDLTTIKDYQVARRGISRTYQDVRLFKNLSIEDHISIALFKTDEFLTKCWNAKKKTKEVREALNFVGLKKPVNTLAEELSFGQRKLLDLAMAIAKPHTILLLDEPVAGVNPALRKQIKSVLKKLKNKGGTIVVIEHDMNFVMDIADNIVVMDQGKVIAEGTPKQIQKNKKVLAAYLGDSHA